MHFDRFLGEIMALNFFFKINWPLEPDWVYLFFSRLFLFDVYFIAAVLRTNGVIKWPTPHFLHCWCGNLSHNFLWWHRQMTTGVGFTPHYDPLFFTFIFVNHCTPPRRIAGSLSPRRIVAGALSPLPLPTALQTCQVGPWRDGELIECDSGATITSQPQRQEDLRLTCLQLRSSILQDDIFVQG